MSATFTAHDHRYVIDGVVIPSVTQILQLAGITDVSGIPIGILYRATEIGIAVHTATEMLDQDDLDLDSIDPLILGYVLAYQKFKEETKFKPEQIELRGVKEDGFPFGYCIDRLGTIGEEDWLLDLKTSSRPQASWQLQTAAYAATRVHDIKRGVVHLAKDGTYKFLRHEELDDILTWEACLRIAHWKLSHGGKIR